MHGTTSAPRDNGDALRSTSSRKLWLCFLFVFIVLAGALNVYLTELRSDSWSDYGKAAARGGRGIGHDDSSVREPVAVVFYFFGALTSAYLPILKLVIGSIRATAPNERTSRVPIVIMFDERDADAVAVARELRRLPRVRTRIAPHITPPYLPKNRPDLNAAWVKLSTLALIEEFEQIVVLDGDMLVTSSAFHATLRPLPAPVTFATSRKGMRVPSMTQWWKDPFNVGIIVHRPSLSFTRGMFASLNAYNARTDKQDDQDQGFIAMFVQERGCYAGELAVVPEHSVANVSLRTPRTLDELHDMHAHIPLAPLHRSAFAHTLPPSPTPPMMALVLGTRSHPKGRIFPKRTKNNSYPLCGPLAAQRLPCLGSDNHDDDDDTSAAHLITRGDERNCAMEPLYYAYLSIDLNMYIALAPSDNGLERLARAAAARHTLGVLHWPGSRKPWRKEGFERFPITDQMFAWSENDYEQCATWLWMLALDAWCPPAPREGAAPPPPPVLAARRLRAAAGPCDRRAVLTQIFDFLSPEKVDKWVHTAFIQSPQLAARLINITDTHALFS